MKIKYKYGLLLVDIRLTFKGLSVVIENMVVDTGAARTLISQNAVEEIGLSVDLQDKLSHIMELVEMILCQENGHIELRFSFSPTALRLLPTRSN